MVNYRSTLNLPRTSFPMRAGLPRSEPLLLRRWEAQGLYDELSRGGGEKLFLLHDGPPYANGNIHVGHAVNKILKDVLVKSRRLAGWTAPYVPGWDCHGLPIEIRVERLLRRSRRSVDVDQFRSLCRRYALRQVERQRRDFVRLGVLASWDRPYSTMDFSVEAHTIRVLGRLISRGYLYRDRKPVHWCADCRSALAEAEVEHRPLISDSVYVSFRVADVARVRTIFGLDDSFSAPISAVVWTTTPWTLPAGRAVSVHPDCSYQLVEIGGEGYILAADAAEDFGRHTGMRGRLLGDVGGRALEFISLCHPLLDRVVPVILGEHVRSGVGTGLVHTAPGHGIEDHLVGSRYGLEVVDLVGRDGCYRAEIPPALRGLPLPEVNRRMIDILTCSGRLLCAGRVEHQHPHCWRHGTAIIFLSTPQWFVDINRDGLRSRLLELIGEMRWIPAWGRSTIEAMVVDRPDWCVSRQRSWGTPMPIFLHRKTWELHPRTGELIEAVAALVERSGIQAWWDLDPGELLGGEAEFYQKSADVLDVWFDSGSTFSSVVRCREEFGGRAPDVCLEGYDQYRGWFMSSLIISAIVEAQVPCRKVLTHGFVVDGRGRKMSKSVGNAVSPRQIVSRLGADVLRLWVSSGSPGKDLVLSDEVLQRTADVYRRVRNTMRFLLGNLDDFLPEEHAVPRDGMLPLDRWAVHQALLAQEKVVAALDGYEPHAAMRQVMRFCSVTMGSFYLEVIKDRQYTTRSDGRARRSCQTGLYHIAEALVRWIAPVLSFTADEAWGVLPGRRSRSVFTERWYGALFRMDPASPLDDDYWRALMGVRTQVNRVLERARAGGLISSSLEVELELEAGDVLTSRLRTLGGELRYLLHTSGARVGRGSSGSRSPILSGGDGELRVSVFLARGRRCDRCWHHEPDVGADLRHPQICSRCVVNVEGGGEERRFV